MRHRLRLLAVFAAAAAASSAVPARAENFFEQLFGAPPQRPQRQSAPPPMANFFADPFGLNAQPAAPPRPVASGGAGFCVRTCDGRYFPLTRAAASPAQICQAFCPAATTKVYFGSAIEAAFATGGERYADSDTAFAYRKALKPDCTCNGRTPTGLAPVDLSLDNSLRAGDILATANGLVAYSGARGGASDFTPVASYPGLTGDVRARLGEMKVAVPASDLVDSPVPAALPPIAVAPKPPPLKLAPGRRADAAPAR